MSKVSEDVIHASPLVEFLNALPSPLTTILVGLGPSIARTRYLVQLLCWKAPWEDSCLVLALWIVSCLSNTELLQMKLAHLMLGRNHSQCCRNCVQGLPSVLNRFQYGLGLGLGYSIISFNCLFHSDLVRDRVGPCPGFRVDCNIYCAFHVYESG
ncbi:hypothetical protein GY45DRAFT_241129 [Cubamyces sp. BRFM 1775]|nr:hypothetical protein GY45DRAFT_241129 [Cubamyces sp. BRFM 1775]